jgi:hypothetical protein
MPTHYPDRTMPAHYSERIIPTYYLIHKHCWLCNVKKISANIPFKFG